MRSQQTPSMLRLPYKQEEGFRFGHVIDFKFRYIIYIDSEEYYAYNAVFFGRPTARLTKVREKGIVHDHAYSPSAAQQFMQVRKFYPTALFTKELIIN